MELRNRKTTILNGSLMGTEITKIIIEVEVEEKTVSLVPKSL